MPRGVKKAKQRANHISVVAAENGWLVTASDNQLEDRKQIVFTDLGELLGFLEEELERS